MVVTGSIVTTMKGVFKIAGYSLIVALILTVFPLVAISAQTDEEQQISEEVECIELEEDCDPIPEVEEQIILEEEINTDGRIPKGEVSQETVAGTNEPEPEPQTLGVTNEPEILAETGTQTDVLSLLTGITIIIFSISLTTRTRAYKFNK